LARKGRFITLEGGEGVGKSTLAAGLADKLRARGHVVTLTREPGGTTGAEALRKLLLTPPEGVTWSAMSEALLFTAARVDHLERFIRPALEAGEIVICDRFSDSTRAYQTAADASMGSVVEALDRMCVGSWGPDLTIILDLPVEIAQQRLVTRGRPADSIEARGPEYHERVREAFMEIGRKEPWRCVIIDTDQPPEDVLDMALRSMDRRLGTEAA
jgi:dTMP kinase